MTDNIVFLVAGGDLRQIYTAKKLAEKFKVYVIGHENSNIDIGKSIIIKSLYDLKERVDVLILPLPISTDGIFLNSPLSDSKIPISSFSRILKPCGIVLGGRITKSIETLLEKYEIHDYSEKEEFAVLNAVPTSEAAIKIALENTQKGFYKSDILITGFGRISKTLARMLRGFGANVTVTARKESDLSWVEIYGYNAMDIGSIKGQYDFIFNTVPSMVINDKVLQNLNADTIIIDLASKPGGVDFEYAKKYSIKTIHALSLPGKYFPVTAGEIVAHTVLNILKERSYPI